MVYAAHHWIFLNPVSNKLLNNVYSPVQIMSRKGFQKGNTLRKAPAKDGSPSKKASPCAPFTTEQEYYVRRLRLFETVNFWSPYTANKLPPGNEHVATIAKVMMITPQRHQSLVESHPRLWQGNQSISN